MQANIEPGREEQEQKDLTPKGKKTLSKIIDGVMIYFVVFVALSWVTFWVKGAIPDTLVMYGLGGSALELLAGSFIEVGKHYIEKKYMGGDLDDGSDILGDSDDSGNM